MLTHRLATEEDLGSLRALMDAAIAENQKAFLAPDQVESSRAVMGLDTQLIADRTYFVIHDDGELGGCGGWSFRATRYGGDHSLDQRDSALLDPTTDAARVRAMYTHPDFTRRGVGTLILKLCEAAALEKGFRKLMLVATLSGEPLYRAAGFTAVEQFVDHAGGAGVPLIVMAKPIG